MDQLNCGGSGRQRWAARRRATAGTEGLQPPPHGKSPLASEWCRSAVCPIQAILESDELN